MLGSSSDQWLHIRLYQGNLAARVTSEGLRGKTLQKCFAVFKITCYRSRQVQSNSWVREKNTEESITNQNVRRIDNFGREWDGLWITNGQSIK